MSTSTKEKAPVAGMLGGYSDRGPMLNHEGEHTTSFAQRTTRRATVTTTHPCNPYRRR